jgi:hypothetical protein
MYEEFRAYLPVSLCNRRAFRSLSPATCASFSGTPACLSLQLCLPLPPSSFLPHPFRLPPPPPHTSVPSISLLLPRTWGASTAFRRYIRTAASAPAALTHFLLGLPPAPSTTFAGAFRAALEKEEEEEKEDESRCLGGDFRGSGRATTVPANCRATPQIMFVNPWSEKPRILSMQALRKSWWRCTGRVRRRRASDQERRERSWQPMVPVEGGRWCGERGVWEVHREASHAPAPAF